METEEEYRELCRYVSGDLKGQFPEKGRLLKWLWYEDPRIRSVAFDLLSTSPQALSTFGEDELDKVIRTWLKGRMMSPLSLSDDEETYTPFAAAWEYAHWFRHLWNQCRLESVLDSTQEVAELILRREADLSLVVQQGIMEHLLESSVIREFFHEEWRGNVALETFLAETEANWWPPESGHGMFE
jgi:hypothetical protein